MVMEKSALLGKLTELASRLEAIKDATGYLHLGERIIEVEEEMAKPTFWDNQDMAQAFIDELKKVKKVYDPMSEVDKSINECTDLLDMVDSDGFDEEVLVEIERESDIIERKVAAIEMRSLFAGTNDDKNVFFSLHAGAGGSDACECAEMLLRMYMRFFEEQGWKAEELSFTPGDEAGLRGVTYAVKGDFVYGNLKSEIGVHRIVRISPFSGKRETSFVGIDVIPEYDDVEVVIDEKDLRIDTYRSGGKGGQHVNKTDSAVRITHIPTGIVVAVQNERSQHKNKAMALKLLAAKMSRMEEAKRQKELGALYSEKGEIAFGSQIRNYVFNPYTQVKDSRTGFEVGDVQKVMDGDISGFINAYLHWSIENKKTM